MIKKPTILILGAGASMDYYFPSGAQLLDDILNFYEGDLFHLGTKEKNDKGMLLLTYLLWLNYKGSTSAPSLETCFYIVTLFFKELFNSSPASIDDFLARMAKNKGENSDKLVFVGKLIIVLIISQYMKSKSFSHDLQKINDNHRYNKAEIAVRKQGKNEEYIKTLNTGWYNYLWERIYDGCYTPTDLKQSLKNLRIITFNYETSLEYFLYTRIKSLFGMNEKEAMDFFREAVNSHHVYGQIYDSPDKYEPINFVQIIDYLNKIIEDNNLRNQQYMPPNYTFYSILEDKLEIEHTNNVFNSTHNPFREESKKICKIASNIKTYHEEGTALRNGDTFCNNIERLFFLGFGYVSQNMDWINNYIFKNFTLSHISYQFYGTTYNFGQSEYKELISDFLKHFKGKQNMNIQFNTTNIFNYHNDTVERDLETKKLNNLKIQDFLINIPKESL